MTTSFRRTHIITADSACHLDALRWKKLIELHKDGEGFCIALKKDGKLKAGGDLYADIIDKLDELIEQDQNESSKSGEILVKEDGSNPTQTYSDLIYWIKNEMSRPLGEGSQAYQEGRVTCAREILEMIKNLGEVTVTCNENHEVVAVTRQDEDHRILSVIWMKNAKHYV